MVLNGDDFIGVFMVIHRIHGGFSGTDTRG